MATQILFLVGFILITALTAVFVAAEFSLTALEHSAVDDEVSQGTRGSQWLQKAHRQLSFALSGTQVGITITTLITGYLAEPVVARLLYPLFRRIPSLSDSAVHGISLGVALVLATVLSMVYGELLPKNWAISEPMRVGRATSPFLMIFSRIFSPVITVLNDAANAIVRRLGVTPVAELTSARSPEELGRLVDQSAARGNLPRYTAKVVQRSLQFGDLSAEDIMTPRSQIVTLLSTDTARDLIQLTDQTGLSRFPVVSEDLDSAMGVVHVKDAFVIPSDELSTTSIRLLMKSLPRIPDSLDADTVLSTIRGSGQQCGLVIDEYGGAAGLVTMEDVVEEILGDVRDEHDERVLDVLKRGDGWEVSGLLRQDEVLAAIGYSFPVGSSFDTLGGLIMSELGRIPCEGDELPVPSLPHPDRNDSAGIDWRARVLEMDGRRVSRVLLTPSEHHAPIALEGV